MYCIHVRLVLEEETKAFSRSIATKTTQVQRRIVLQETQEIGPEDFELLCVIGQGAFGKVIQVRHIPTQKIYAMKVKWNSNSLLSICTSLIKKKTFFSSSYDIDCQ